MTDRTDILRRAMASLELGGRPQSLINGVLVDGAGVPIDLVDPFTGRVLMSYPDADAPLADLACEAAQTAQTAWATELTGAQRGRIMCDVARAVMAHIDPLATIERSSRANRSGIAVSRLPRLRRCSPIMRGGRINCMAR